MMILLMEFFSIFAIPQNSLHVEPLPLVEFLILEGGCSIRCELTALTDASNVLELCHVIIGILLLCYEQPNVLTVIKMS